MSQQPITICHFSQVKNIESCTPKEVFLMKQVIEFFHQCSERVEILQKFRGKNDGLSLRILEYSVIHYARTRQHTCPKTSDGIQHTIYSNYLQNLKLYTKKYFDPCCRGSKDKRYIITTNPCPKQGKCDGECSQSPHIETTLRQLNFFRWAIQWGIIDYVVDNLEDIKYHMSKNGKRTLDPESLLERVGRGGKRRRLEEAGSSFVIESHSFVEKTHHVF